MSTLSYILIFTFLGSIASLIGGIALLYKEKFAKKISHLLASFAAGTLLGVAFFDLLPEALRLSFGHAFDMNVSFWTLLGILAFFLLERFIHHHDDHPKEGRPLISLVVAGDSVHNFIDGVAVAASFLISIPLGITTTLAVVAHEIPQEIGDFGLMLKSGMRRQKIILINLLTACTALAGALLTYLAKDSLYNVLPAVLALTSGFFIYIAASKLIPEIHSEEKKEVAFWETVLLLLGVVVIWALV